MKIIRHLTPAGPAYAALQSDGSAREITGDIFGDFRVTEHVVVPGKLLAPIEPVYLPCIGLNYKKHAAESNSPLPPRLPGRLLARRQLGLRRRQLRRPRPAPQAAWAAAMGDKEARPPGRAQTVA
jgi:hypothetical protein